jgi:hypothetical protein
MVQSVLRYLALPLILIGIWFGFRQSIEMSGVLIATVVYYLATLSVAHSEVRYALPMHGIFCVFAAIAVSKVILTARGSNPTAKEGWWQKLVA